MDKVIHKIKIIKVITIILTILMMALTLWIIIGKFIPMLAPEIKIGDELIAISLLAVIPIAISNVICIGIWQRLQNKYLKEENQKEQNNKI